MVKKFLGVLIILALTVLPASAQTTQPAIRQSTAFDIFILKVQAAILSLPVFPAQAELKPRHELSDTLLQLTLTSVKRGNFSQAEHSLDALRDSTDAVTDTLNKKISKNEINDPRVQQLLDSQDVIRLGQAATISIILPLTPDDSTIKQKLVDEKKEKLQEVVQSVITSIAPSTATNPIDIDRTVANKIKELVGQLPEITRSPAAAVAIVADLTGAARDLGSDNDTKPIQQAFARTLPTVVTDLIKNITTAGQASTIVGALNQIAQTDTDPAVQLAITAVIERDTPLNDSSLKQAAGQAKRTVIQRVADQLVSGATEPTAAADAIKLTATVTKDATITSQLLKDIIDRVAAVNHDQTTIDELRKAVEAPDQTDETSPEQDSSQSSPSPESTQTASPTSTPSPTQ